MSRETAPKFLNWPELFGNPSVPLFLLELEVPRPATAALAEPLTLGETWSQTLTQLVEQRTFERIKAVEPYPFSPDGAWVLVDYINLAASRSLELPVAWRPRVECWPEAARRLSLILAVVDSQFEGTVSRNVVAAAVGIIEWFGRASLHALAALWASPPARPSPVRPARHASLRDRMLERVQERGPISLHDLRRSFSNSREAFWVPVRDALLAEGCIGWVEGTAGP